MNVSRCKTKTVVLTLECRFTNAKGPVPRKDPTKSYSVACAPGMGDGGAQATGSLHFPATFAIVDPRERQERNLFTTKQIINVTNKINLCGRLPVRKFPSDWPPMLIQIYIILYKHNQIKQSHQPLLVGG